MEVMNSADGFGYMQIVSKYIMVLIDVYTYERS